MAVTVNQDKVTPLVTKWAVILGTLGAVAASILSLGVLDSYAEQYPWAKVLLQLLTLLAGVGGAVTGGRLARRHVTPIDNPQIEIAGRLVPLVPEHVDPPPKNNSRQRQSRIADERSP